jgi:hypothetical protein
MFGSIFGNKMATLPWTMNDANSGMSYKTKTKKKPCFSYMMQIASFHANRMLSALDNREGDDISLSPSNYMKLHFQRCYILQRVANEKMSGEKIHNEKLDTYWAI